LRFSSARFRFLGSSVPLRFTAWAGAAAFSPGLSGFSR
jgi:hypothetical protein